jgi:formate dehydrogenase subunit gamma
MVRALALVLLVGAGVPGQAADLAPEQAKRQVEQPLNNAPMWREVRSGQENYTSVRGVETGVLIQSGGETWRALRNGPLTLWGGILLCVVVVAIGLYYRSHGPLKMHEAPTGRKMERFNGLERATHWAVAITFCVLALTGLILVFGKHVLLPLFGYTLFAWIAQLAKYIHNFSGPLFTLAIVVMFFLFVRDNVWQAADAEWIRRAGGLLSGEHVPSHRFNFGEKTWFWIGVFFLGIALSVSGLVLNFPNFEQGRFWMQVANITHLASAVIVVCLSLGHIYMGTIGVDGAFDSMRTGYVDETWAKEHHELWYREHEALERQAQREPPAAGSGAAVHS